MRATQIPSLRFQHDPSIDFLWKFVMAALSAISCTSDSMSSVETGAIEVTSSTTGNLADPDGYTVTVDGASGQPIGNNASITVTDLAPGSHTVELSGLASNCTVTGSNPTGVTVQANATAQSSFTVTCVSGSIEIITATSGNPPDPDGYVVSLDGNSGQAMGVNTSLTLEVAPGSHTVELSGLASNCTVTGGNPSTLTVAANTTVQSDFAVTCVSGSIEITTATSGAVPDPDGYALSLDGNPEQAIGINGSLTVSEVTPGSHSVQLAGLANNCSVTGVNPKTVTVVANTTAEVSFDVTCPSPGTIRVTVSTTGTNIPGLFIAFLDPPSFQFFEVAPNGSVASPGLSTGSHTVSLGVSSNCSVTSPTPQTVTVQPGVTTDVHFTAVCT